MTTSKKRVFDYDQLTKTNYVVDLVVRGIFSVVRLMPYDNRIPAAGWLSRVVLGPLGGINRRIRKNLQYVRPELSAAEVKNISQGSCDTFGRVTMESISTDGFVHYAENAELSGPGLTALKDALKAKRPIVLISGHFGNYQVIRVLLRQMGHDVAAVYRPMNNGYTNRHYINNMNKIAGPNFSVGMSGTKQIVGHLRAGGVAAMLIDQHSNRGERLQFMGKLAWTMISAADMALKYDALLVPYFGIRKDDGLNFNVVIEKPIAHSNAHEMIQKFNDLLEAKVWDNPGQWFWIHRRWKRQDPED